MRALRRIFKNQFTGKEHLRELLQTMFVGELLAPSRPIFIVSPWISNVALIDNRTGRFDALNPEWGRREVRVADVLIALMGRGSIVHIATRRDERNTPFLKAIRSLSIQHGVQDALTLHQHKTLHTKGIQLGDCSLTGSMNLTYFGIEMNDEHVTFSIEPEDLARTRLEFESYLESV